MDVWQETETYAISAVLQYGNRLYTSLQDANIGNLPDAVESEWWVLYLDPITQVYYALWTLLEAHAPLAALVKVGNRIKYSGEKRDPTKTEVSDADLPELRIFPVSSTPHLQRTSDGSSLLKQFRVAVATGDQRVDAGLFAVEWEVYRALSTWAITLMALTWNEKTYVKLVRPKSVQDGASQADAQRGIKGWSSLWECEVEMWFTTGDLKEE